MNNGVLDILDMPKSHRFPHTLINAVQIENFSINILKLKIFLCSPFPLWCPSGGKYGSALFRELNHMDSLHGEVHRFMETDSVNELAAFFC